MKKLILILSVFVISCSKQDCDQQLEDLKKQYVNSLNNSGSSSSAIAEITKQYNAKKQQILKDCE